MKFSFKTIFKTIKDNVIKNPKIVIIPSIITTALVAGIITTININKTPAAILKEEVKEISYKNEKRRPSGRLFLFSIAASADRLR